MNRRYRRTIIAANLKMNKTATETKALCEEMKALLPKNKWCDVVVCAPFVNIATAMRVFRDTRISVGAQNVHYEESGAYTGEVSAAMLADVGVKYAIIGHSERRRMFGESDIVVNKKLNAVLKTGMNAIVCVGETQAQREMGVTMDVIATQVKSALHNVSAQQLKNVVIAYEPVWAIGTGLAATAQEANEVCAHIRSVVRGLYGARAARAMTIQYGGSMNGKNAAELLAQPDIDGGLIGGASLVAEDFMKIIDAANQ